eukprot:TRINITY_DN18999_c0_g1_i1.p1 TRINITY_DN18999_c0_g1~~TRINITY_DN18999_c0_g1_i1.p1  ORF type:complete len:908 (-),score=127.88 TRINITY_DN18999_c0_g1_i1:58-2700(-)
MHLAGLLLCSLGPPLTLIVSSDSCDACDRHDSTSCTQDLAAGSDLQQQLDEVDETLLIQRTSRQQAAKAAGSLLPPELSILDEDLVKDAGAEELLANEGGAGDVFREKYYKLFGYVGCYPLLGDDSVEGDEDSVSLRDMSCADRPKKHLGGPVVPCRSGLPFFRYLFDSQGSDDCSRFCSSKGFDLAGTLARNANQSKTKFECRCGATLSNVAAWQRSWPDKRLLFQLNGSVHPNDPRCKIVVNKYSGGFENMGMPQELITLTEDDTNYIKDIVEANPFKTLDEEAPDPNAPKTLVGEIGHLLSTKELETAKQVMKNGSQLLAVRRDVYSALETKKQRSEIMCTDKPDTGLTIGGDPAPCSALKIACGRDDDVGIALKNSCLYTCGLCTTKDRWTDCYPESCGPRKIWKTQNSDGNIIIRYVFDWEIDDMRRAAFRAATKEWESGTCIRFEEGGSKPRVRVVMTNTGTCSATTGFPGEDGEAQINLGWCRSMQQLGNIIHELGHTLGMNHEQKRPDATGTIWLPDQQKYEGPYLKVFWQNIPASWQSQYFPDRMSYTGSGSQQTGDPHSGYAAYDYGSIMHYSTGLDRFTATNPAFDSVIGQRVAPSPGDLNQIRDMYQCGTAVLKKSVEAKSEKQSDWWNPLSWFLRDEASILHQWVAGPYGNCKHREDPTSSERKCYRSRVVSCEDWNAESVEVSHCIASKKPLQEEECTCPFSCADRYPTLLKMGGQDLSCYQLKSKCHDATLGSHVRQVCPRTCNTCTDNFNANPPDCRDMLPYALILDVYGKFMSCAALAQSERCNGFSDSPQVQERCPESCGLCPKKLVPDEHLVIRCEDDKEFRTSDHQSCHVFSGYNCSTVDESEAIMKACPKSCDLCKRLS